MSSGTDQPLRSSPPSLGASSTSASTSASKSPSSPSSPPSPSPPPSQSPSPSTTPRHSSTSSSYLGSSFFSSAVSGLLRRLSTDPTVPTTHANSMPDHDSRGSTGNTHEPHPPHHRAKTAPLIHHPPPSSDLGLTTPYNPPRRTASPFQPPPLTPLCLTGYRTDTPPSARLLSRALAEEIRLLLPVRLQLVEEWRLTYSLEENGVSLGTLYQCCEECPGAKAGGRGGFVLVVRDGSGGVFGAFLTHAPRPSPHYYGTGECFLWKASLLSPLANLPPPPSSDTTHMTRSTTIRNSDTSSASTPRSSSNGGLDSESGKSTPANERFLRFKAFPYSGLNDYMILCEPGFLSVGGGDGHYGLWLDDTFEKGVSSTCPTFGNERLSEVGEKFEILGVEVWYVG